MEEKFTVYSHVNKITNTTYVGAVKEIEIKPVDINGNTLSNHYGCSRNSRSIEYQV